jgi:hypothetical protein
MTRKNPNDEQLDGSTASVGHATAFILRRKTATATRKVATSSEPQQSEFDTLEAPHSAKPIPCGIARTTQNNGHWSPERGGKMKIV